jgi:hypothetical protein
MLARSLFAVLRCVLTSVVTEFIRDMNKSDAEMEKVRVLLVPDACIGAH